MRTNDEASGMVQSDITLIAVINGLQRLEEAGVTELATYLNLSKSTVHKHLKTLENNYYVVNQAGSYKLSFRFLNHGGQVRARTILCNRAKYKVREIARDTDEMSMFSVKEHDFGIYTNIRNDKYGFALTNPLGSQFRLHETASGKAMLAELQDKEIDNILERQNLPGQTENTITDRDKLFDHIALIRERGYAFDLEESSEGIQAIGAAIYSETDDLYGALSIGGPAHRLTRERLKEEYAPVVLGAINEIQLEMEYGDGQ